MDDQTEANTSCLLPQPKRIRGCKGYCRVYPDSPLVIHTSDRRVERAALRYRRRATAAVAATTASYDCVPQRTMSIAAVKAMIRITEDTLVVDHPQGYRIDVGKDHIEITGGSPAGCFYGLQTLEQWTQPGIGLVPRVTIVDWPDFATRGLLHDVTRGKVPKLETLKMLAERLGRLKINQLQLYLEHAFVFSFDPDICRPGDGLTGDELRELDCYCRERFIDLVPALATLGHMGRILSMDTYRHLAEIPTTTCWRDMDFVERTRGLTLDITNPQSHVLVERMWSDVLDASSAATVNLCGDEPFDLGRGINRHRFAKEGIATAYAAHIRRMWRLGEARGRRAQLFGDVLRHHPEVLDRLPRSLALLHWGYDDQADYEGCAPLIEAGFETLVCPGTSGWKRILNAMNRAERNILAFARVGHQYGATGLLNTDWGDHGHFNVLAGSYHGIALGAACGWSHAAQGGDDFDERFAQVVLGLPDAAPVGLLRRASAIADRCETWRLLWQPHAAQSGDVPLVSQDELDQTRQAAQRFRQWRACLPAALSQARSDPFDPCGQLDLDELAIACRFTELLVDKLSSAQRRGTSGVAAGAAAKSKAAFEEELACAARDYARCWNARNKPTGLSDILLALQAIPMQPGFEPACLH